MRGIFVYYLKILCLFYALQLISGNVIKTTANAAYKRILNKRSLPFEDCGSKYHVLYLNIDSCSTIPCGMQRGSTVKITVLFDDKGNDISFLKHKVRWVFNYIKTQAAISPDPCDGNHQCIMQIDDSKSYWANVFVNESLPTVRGTMLWEAVDEKNVKLICFEVPIVITI